MRITGQLIDATTGMHLWADRFDGSLDDIFDLQDRVAASVVGAIAPQLENAEIARAKRKPTGSLDAYDYYLRGIASLNQEPTDRKANSERSEAVPKGNRTRSGLRRGLRHGSLVLRLAQGKWLGH